MKIKEKRGFGVEAKALGADIRAIRAKWAPLYREPTNSAADIRAVWDYRAAGLTVDQAKKKIKRWCANSYPRNLRLVQSPGRIQLLQKRLVTIRAKYAEAMATVTQAIPGTWANDRMVWMSRGRLIVTERIRDVVWATSGWCYRHRVPECVRVTYYSRLLTQEPMAHAKALLREMGWVEPYHGIDTVVPSAIRARTEKEIEHNARGAWQKRVADAFGVGPYVDTSLTQKYIAYKKVAVEPGVPGVVYSLYDCSPYTIGVERSDTARPDHGGGLYCYATANEASDADVKICDAAKLLPHRVVKVEVSGRCIKYSNGKMAWSKMTVLAD